jgi:hypothetical protein
VVLAVLPGAHRILLPVSDDALFDVDTARPARPGQVAATFARLVDAGRAAGTLVDEDAALIEGVRVLAEALDTAHRLGGMKGGYLAVQALPPYQRGLHALRLPVELTAVSQSVPAPDSRTDTPDWLRDAFGSAE